MVTLAQLALVALLGVPVVAAAEPPVFRFFMRFGFGDGQIGDPAQQPTEEDVKGLMCKANEFFTESIQNYTDNTEVEFFATEISYDFDDWIYNGTEPEAPRNVPVIVNFTAKLVTKDGSEPPTNQELWEGTKYFEYYTFIMQHMWQIEGDNFFKNARGLWYEPFIQPAVQGDIADNDQCPSPATGRGDSFTLTTMSPSVAPSIMAAMPTRKPTGRFGGLNIPMGTPRTPAPSTAPSQRVDPGRASGFELATMAPTRPQDEMVYFTIQVDFFAGKEREPTDDEVNSVMCKADQFFLKTLQDKIDPDVDVYGCNIHWEWDDRAGLPSMIEFFANATMPDGEHVPAQEVFDAMEKVDVEMFVKNYIWQAEPYQENQFYQTEDIFFAGSYTGSANPPEPHEGNIHRAQCS